MVALPLLKALMKGGREHLFGVFEQILQAIMFGSKVQLDTIYYLTVSLGSN